MLSYKFVIILGNVREFISWKLAENFGNSPRQRLDSSYGSITAIIPVMYLTYV